MHRVHLLIHGRVQGVGYRYFVLRQARSLRVTGEVRNRPDGTVEVEAEGEAGRLRELVETLRRGPPAARVSGVEETWSEGPARHREFTIAN